MSAYVISEVEVLDGPTFDRYRALAQESIEEYGGGWSSWSFPTLIIVDGL